MLVFVSTVLIIINTDLRSQISDLKDKEQLPSKYEIKVVFQEYPHMQRAGLIGRSINRFIEPESRHCACVYAGDMWIESIPTDDENFDAKFTKAIATAENRKSTLDALVPSTQGMEYQVQRYYDY